LRVGTQSVRMPFQLYRRLAAGRGRLGLTC
jgi:hypothetical protein